MKVGSSLQSTGTQWDSIEDLLPWRCRIWSRQQELSAGISVGRSKALVFRNMLIRNVRLGKTSEYQLQMDVSQWKTKVTRGSVCTDICQSAPMDGTHTALGTVHTHQLGTVHTPKKENIKENSKENSLPPKGGKEKNHQKDLRESLAEVCGLKTTSHSSRRRINRIVNDLSERDATSAAIKARADRYRDRWPAMALTPEALEKHWDSLGRAEHDGEEADEEREKRKVYAPASVPKGVA